MSFNSFQCTVTRNAVSSHRFSAELEAILYHLGFNNGIKSLENASEVHYVKGDCVLLLNVFFA